MKNLLLSSIIVILLTAFTVGCIMMYPDYNDNGVLDTNETLYPTQRFRFVMDYYLQGNGNPSYEKYGERVVLNNIDTRYVTDMASAFHSYTNFNLDISHFDTSNVLYMESMFQDAKSFNQDISNWDVSKVTNMYQMFYKASSFNQDLSNWFDKIGNVKDMHAMFAETSLYQDLSSWDITGIPSQGMFDDTPMQDKLEWHPEGCGCLRH